MFNPTLLHNDCQFTTIHLAKLNYFILLIGQVSIITENFLTGFYLASHSHQKKKEGKKKCTIQTDLSVPTDLCNESSLFDKQKSVLEQRDISKVFISADGHA